MGVEEELEGNGKMGVCQRWGNGGWEEGIKGMK